MLAFSGCGVGSSVVNNRSYNTQSESGSSYAEDVEDIDDMETDEDYYDEDSQIYDVQSKYLKAIQDYSGTELNDLTPDNNIENFEYPEDESSMQKNLNELKKILQEVYGSNVEISFEQSSFEEFDVQKLNNALSEDDDEDGGDVDTIETLNKTMKDVVETGCNLQRCIKSDMTFRMSGDKGEDTQTVASYIYEVDGEYYMDTYAFDKLLQGQKMALEEKQSGNSDYSTADLNLDQYDGEDLNYSSLLLDQR
jgi:hypothetical protein